jgi:phage terminase large subunit
MTKLEEARRKIKTWRKNPCQYVLDHFQVTPDKWQEQALNAFASGDESTLRISLTACAGPGKSAALAWMGWNFLSCYGDRGEHPKGAAVSITATNLKDNLWAELSKWQSRSEFLMRTFKWTQERIFAVDHASTWFLSARSFSKSANAEEQGRTLSGVHSKYVLFLIDESGDIPITVGKAAEQALSTSPRFGKIVQAGNPTSKDGMLYAASTSLRHLWYVIRITGDPDDPNRSPRIGLEWAKEQIRTYGRENPWVMAFILGLFPPGSLNTLLSIEDVEAAMSRTPHDDSYTLSQKRLGVDVARFGLDETILFPRQGLLAFKPADMRGARSHEIAARIAMAEMKWGHEVEFVDDTGGYGSGVIDARIQGGASPIGINAAGKADDPRYLNKRAETWFRMAEWVKRGGCLVRDPQLIRELTVPTYWFQNGKFQLEPKDLIKEKLGQSPDRADALCLTFAWVEMPTRPKVPGMKEGSSLLAEYDPYDPARS